MESLVLVMMTYLIVKHFVCDFPHRIQTPWMFQNKGTYGHPGGLVHAGIHAVVSAPIFLWVASWVHRGGEPEWYSSGVLWNLFWILLFEYNVHYHMDWFKMWWCKKKQYKPDTHAEFWTWLGIDQMVHYMTYVVMVWIWVT